MFSLGYGEDDDKEGDVLTVPLNSGRLVSAVDEVGIVVVGVGVVVVVEILPWRYCCVSMLLLLCWYCC